MIRMRKFNSPAAPSAFIPLKLVYVLMILPMSYI
jgi:hypothetical protein